MKNDNRIVWRKLNKFIGSKLFIIIALFLFAVFSSFYIYETWTSSLNETSDQAMNIALTAKISINEEMLKELTVSSSDVGTASYEEIKKSLTELIKVNKQIRFAYLYTQTDGKVYFMADSEPVGSDDYSPPGQEYSEAGEAENVVFKDGKAMITDPATDRWGTWVSILIPITDTETGDTIAVFGMDYPAEKWPKEAITNSFKSGVNIFILFWLLYAFYRSSNKNAQMKEAQIIINENIDLYSSIIRASPDAIIITDLSGHILMNSSLGVEMFGYDHDDEQSGKIITDFFIPEDRERAAANHLFMIQGYQPKEVPYRGLSKGGYAFDIEVNSDFIKNAEGSPSKIIFNIRDITKRNETEKAFRESESLTHAITDSAQDAIIMMDHNGLISYWNPAAQRILGYTSEEAIGRNLHTFIVPSRYYDSHHAAFPIFQNTGSGNAVGKILDLEAKRKDSTEISIQLSLSVVKMSGGWHSVGIIRDISTQKQAETDLKKAKETAETATKAKSEFLANMSHEIRTPMNAILGFSELLRKTDMSLKQQDYVEKIVSSSEALLGIINDILDFSKIEAGKLEMEKINFNLDDVIKNIVSMISVKASEKNIELLNNITNDVPYALKGDPLRLGQVLINLTNNAVKFTENGHILLKSELAEKNADKCRIKFSVSDTGIGMTKEQMSKLFMAFSQADSSVTRRFGGTGLGLTISKHLVEMMNGKISAESEYGVGSTFSFTAEFELQTEETDKKTTDMERFKKLKVLIVDDNEMARTILKEQLASFGINAFTVDSGKAAISKIEQESIIKPYDLVFMDWRMPDMDGIETAKNVYQNSTAGQQLPMIIMVTAFAREEVINKAKKIGIDSFLMKPVNQSLLFDTIMNAFEMNNIESLTRKSKKDDKADITFGISGVKVLLVEDNVLNQEIATAILENAGVVVELANNGKEAAEAVQKNNYDLILMDLQMPVMGGYEATGIIRADKKYKDLPIIAMTAHAMHGAKEECLAAGMNDYISKPINPGSLFSIIRKWSAPKELHNEIKINEINSNEPDNHSNSSQTGLSDIDMDAGLERLNGNIKLYKKLLIDFFENYSSLSEDIRKETEKNDFIAALRLAHTLKGVAGNLSACAIQHAAAELETIISQNKKEKFNLLIIELDKAFKSFNKTLKVLNKTDDPPVGNDENPHSVPEVKPVLLELARLVWEDNVDAENAITKLQKCIDNSKFNSEIQKIIESVSDFNFEAAKEPIKSIAEKMNIEIGEK